MKYVAAAPGRSGTMYIADLLTAAGLSCGHEKVFVGWGGDFEHCSQWRTDEYLGDASYIAAPFLAEVADALTVVHLVRPPLDQIRSVVGLAHVANLKVPWVGFLDHHAKLAHYPPGPVRAAQYWLNWNRLILPHADVTWPLLEVDETHILDLATRISEPFDLDAAVRAVGATDRRTNHRQRAEWVTLEHLGELADQVAAMAEQFGVPLEAEGYVADAEIVDDEPPAGGIELIGAGGGWWELVQGGQVLEKVRGKTKARARLAELEER